jgi:hypothetical protein
MAPLPGNSFFAVAQVGHADGPQIPFLALESGPGNLRLGAVRFEPKGTSTGFFAGGRVSIADHASPLPADRVFFMYNFFQNSFGDNQSLGALDTNGDGLGIPGTGDPMANFPAGIFLPNAGGLNNVQNINGRFSFDTFGGGVAVGTSLRNGPVVVAPFVGVDFASLDQKTQLGGEVPGFNLDFNYRTRANSMQVSPNVGALITIPLITDPGAGPQLNLTIIPRVFVDTVLFGGSDRLDLAGIVNDRQKVSLSGSDTNVGFAVNVDVSASNLFGLPLDVKVGAFVQDRQIVTSIRRTGQVNARSNPFAARNMTFGANIGFRYRLQPTSP